MNHNFYQISNLVCEEYIPCDICKRIGETVECPHHPDKKGKTYKRYLRILKNKINKGEVR
jgi:hypothetical protein